MFFNIRGNMIKSYNFVYRGLIKGQNEIKDVLIANI